MSGTTQEIVSSERCLRIAVLSRMFRPTGGGAERYSIALVQELAHRHEIHVFAQQVGDAIDGVVFHPISTPLSRPRWINQWWFALATWWATRRGFDVVHSHENTWHGQVQTVHVLPIKYNLFVGLTGLQKVLRIGKVMASPRLIAYLALEWLRYRVQDGRSIVVTSDSLLGVMAKTYPHTVGALTVIPPGISAVPGVSPADARRVARAQLGLPLEGSCLLFIGNDYRKKGLPTLLKALEKLRADVFLVVVGNGSQIPEFRTLADHLGLQSRVFFLGALTDINPAYLAADCLVHPTLEDTFGMVVLEAMAHGLPVVLSDARYCGVAGLLQHMVNAFIVQDPLDDSVLEKAIRTVMADESLRESLSLHATAFAQDYLWSAQARRQALVYQQVVLSEKN